ncbi:MAG TPA: (Fe-S)-binding protein [Thermoanaerobaculia bacterium]|nr:(Fe-S)-binding protein [Thermoanaerobaculia bacterium]
MTGVPASGGRRKPEAVYFFGTCLVDLFYPGAGLSAIQLLQREGVRVVFPRGQTCCGQPAFNSGYREEARSVAAAQIRLFSGTLPVVVPSGSCAGMIRRHYRELFAGDPLEAEAEDFASRVVELTQFLCGVLDVPLVDRGERIRVAWHGSCHALREAGVEDEPLRLLAQLSNVEVAPLSRERECCGFGGTFAVRHPEISAAMVEDKAEAVSATGADVVLSGDAGCLLNIGGRLEAKGATVRTAHVAEFLWERTRER